MSAPLLATLRHHDWDRFVCTLFADKEDRSMLLALYAFNHEIGKIPYVTSDSMTAHIRLTWWREAIEELYDKTVTPRKHEVIQALAPHIVKFSKKHFVALLEGREQDIEHTTPVHMEELEDYAGKTSSSLLLLGLEGLGISQKVLKEAIRHLGVAWTLTGLLRSAYYQLPQGRCYFPQDLMEHEDISPDFYGSDRFLDGSRIIVEEMVDRAEEHLVLVDDVMKKADKQTRKHALSLLLLSPLAHHYLSCIRENNFDVLSHEVDAGKMTLIFQLIKSAWFDRG